MTCPTGGTAAWERWSTWAAALARAWARAHRADPDDAVQVAHQALWCAVPRLETQRSSQEQRAYLGTAIRRWLGRHCRRDPQLVQLDEDTEPRYEGPSQDALVDLACVLDRLSTRDRDVLVAWAEGRLPSTPRAWTQKSRALARARALAAPK